MLILRVKLFLDAFLPFFYNVFARMKYTLFTGAYAMLRNSSILNGNSGKVFYFTDENYNKFCRKVNAVNRKIQKISPYAVQVSFDCVKENVPFREVYHNAPVYMMDAYAEVNAVRFNSDFTSYYAGENTKILGIIDHKENVIYGESPVLMHFMDRKDCDHCHRKINRNRTLIIETEIDGKKNIMQVGGECVKEYAGIDLALIALMLDIQSGSGLNEREFSEKGCNVPVSFNLYECAGRIFKCIRKHGFNSRKNCPNNATADIVIDSFLSAEGERFELNENDNIESCKIIEKMKDMNVNTPFDLSVRNIVRNEEQTVSLKQVSYLAAGMARYLVARRIENNASKWIGAVGDIIDVECIVENVKSVQSRFGMQTVYEMKDNGCNCISWFSSRNYAVGTKLHVSNATVKKHNEWQGLKSTVIGGRGIKAEVL